MARSAEEKLVFTLEARIKDLERNNARAKQNVQQTATVIEGRFKKMGDNISTGLAESAKHASGFLSRLGMGGLIGGGALGLATAMQEIAHSVAEVDREARKAGVSAKVWQEWASVASATGMSVDGVTDALKELNIRGAEFAGTGQGGAADAFKRLGFSAEDVASKLKDPNKFLDEIIGKLQKLDAAGQTLALDELLGGTGAEQLAKVLGMSVDQIRKMRDEAKTFSDDQIEAAKKIDAQFSTMWRNFTIYAKSAALEGVRILGGVRDFLNPGKATYDAAVERYNSPEEQVKRLQKQRADIVAAIDREKLNTGNVLQQAELRNLEMALKAVDEQIHEVTGGSEEFKQTMKELSEATNRLENSFERTAQSTANFKSALAELKGFVPELKAELDTLATTNGIDAAYQRAVKNARTMGEVMQATQIAQRARNAERFGNTTNFLDLLGGAEGTDKGRSYNESLGYGAFTGGAQNLTGMTLKEVRALQRKMLADPNNTFNSSALGRYQITGQTLDDLMRTMGLSGDEYFDSGMQDRMAQQIMRWAGPNVDKLRGRWEGLKGVDDQTIMRAYNGTSASMPAVDESVTQKSETLKEQKTAYDDIMSSGREFIAQQDTERQALGMTTEAAARLKYETQLLTEAKRAGLSLAPDEIAALQNLAAEMAKAEVAAQGQAKSVEDAKQAASDFSNAASGVAKGFVSDLVRGKSAADALRNALGRIGDMALDGLLNQLFGGGNTKGGGLFGSLFSGLFSKIFPSIGKNAKGTDNWRGGPTWVGEEGPEIINAPKGSQIVPNHLLRAPKGAASVRKGSAQGGASKLESALTVNINGASGDPHVKELVRQGVQEALAGQQEQMRRGGFGDMQTRFHSQRG